MSSELANQFGSIHHEKYEEVINSWADKLVGKKITPEIFEEWGKDLHEALSEDLLTTLSANIPFSNNQLKLPSKETLKRFAQISVKYSLQYATKDLLDRLQKSARFNEENPPEETVDTFDGEKTLIAAIRPMRPSELAKRSPQTVAQIFDMAKDRFSSVLGRHFTKTKQFTGRRRWNTVGKDSRHSSLNHEIRSPEAHFSYKGEKIFTPRPVGGSPAHWSNCSCTLSFERSDGKWIDE